MQYLQYLPSVVYAAYAVTVFAIFCGDVILHRRHSKINKNSEALTKPILDGSGLSLFRHKKAVCISSYYDKLPICKISKHNESPLQRYARDGRTN